MADDLGGMTTQFGLINSLRTGNMLLDMMVCMIVPLLFGGIGQMFRDMVPLLKRLKSDIKNRNRVERSVQHTKRINQWGYSVGASTPDHLLQKAIMLYVSKHVPGQHKKASFTLASTRECGASGGAAAEYDSDDDSNGCGSANMLNKLDVATMPPEGVEVDVGNGIRLIKSKSEDDSGGDSKSGSNFKEETCIIKLSSTAASAEEDINAFVNKAFAWYKANMEQKKDEKRYMFVMIRPKGGAAAEESSRPGAERRLYKRYALSNEKTFSSLFFPEKPQLLYLLDHFTKKTGKFSVPGFPHKLGLLLYGPPGTGKTSLIKAIAHHTGRHIVSVPLSKIRTNQELTDVMFDQAFSVVNTSKVEDSGDAENINITLDFSKIIFVMEDVDAAGKVVHRRAPAGGGVAQTRTVTRTIVRNPTHGPTTAGISRQATGAHDDATRPTPLLLPSRGRSERMGHPPTPKAGAHAKLAPTDEVNDKDQAKLEPAHNGTSPAGAAVAAAMAAAAATATEHEAEAEAEVTEEIVMVEAGPFAKDKKSLFDDEDKLDLAGLLNVLDGVVDSPNRIVIMTTNHPEKLDPALVRPGRINKKMLLGYLYLPEAEKMVEHYFGKMTDRQRDRMDQLFTPNVFTPAQVEQLCAEYDTVDDFLLGLKTLHPQEY